MCEIYSGRNLAILFVVPFPLLPSICRWGIAKSVVCFAV